MTTVVNVINRALQTFGSRTTVTSAELAANSTNEAIQANLVYENCRDDLLRMAPWNCSRTPASLVYITSVPGTPENTSAATNLWQRGQPQPPWLYEFQYPADCLRPCWIVPQSQQGTGGVPIFPSSTGLSPVSFAGAPVKYAVAVDQFYPVTAAAVAAGGTGYAVGDYITLASGAAGSAPIGAPAKLLVTAVAAGVITTVSVVSQVYHDADGGTDSGGSYFSPQTNPIAQGSTTGSGTGATFNLTFGALGDQRVILTNEEYPILVYCKRVTDPNVMDTLFQSAWINVIGASICMALTGDKALANDLIKRANVSIEQARDADGNEGLAVFNSTPDWLRVRGNFMDGLPYSPTSSYDWGAVWPLYT